MAITWIFEYEASVATCSGRMSWTRLRTDLEQSGSRRHDRFTPILKPCNSFKPSNRSWSLAAGTLVECCPNAERGANDA
jgi:hypothetical protein